MIGPEWQMPKSREVIDARQRFVIPGIVDPHVHYGLIPEPGGTFAEACKRDWKPDSVGAAFGGVTTVMPMLMSHETYVPVTRELIGWANENSATDFAMTVIVHNEEAHGRHADAVRHGCHVVQALLQCLPGRRGRADPARPGR